MTKAALARFTNSQCRLAVLSVPGFIRALFAAFPLPPSPFGIFAAFPPSFHLVNETVWLGGL
jgi:hypothetical protein